MSSILKTARLRDSVTKTARLLVQDSVRVSQRGAKPMVKFDHNGKASEVVLPTIPDTPSDELTNHIQGFLDHEAGHVLFTDNKPFMNLVKRSIANKYDPARMHNMANLFEDVRINACMIQKFKGSAHNITNCYMAVYQWITPAVETAKSMSDPSERAKATISAAFVPWTRALLGDVDARNFMDKHGLWSEFDMILKAFPKYVDRLRELKTSQDAADLAFEFIQAVQPLIPPPPPSPAANPQKSPEKNEGDKDKEESGDQDGKPEKEPEGGEGQDTDRDSEGDGTGEEHETPEEDTKEQEEKGDQDGEPGDDGSDGDAEEEEEEDQGGADAEPDDEEQADEGVDDDAKDGEEGQAGDKADDDAESGEQSEQGDQDGQESTSAAGSDNPEPQESEAKEQTSQDEEEDGTEPLDEEQSRIVNEAMGDIKDIDTILADVIGVMMPNEFSNAPYIEYTRDWDRIEVAPSVENAPVEAWENEVQQISGTMQKDLQRIITARSQAINVPGYRRGRLNPAALHRLTSGDDRVFRRKHVNNTKDVAVQLVCDNSGSMSGPKMELAMKSAWAFSSVLDRLGIANEVIGFTTGDLPEGITTDPRVDMAAQIGVEYYDIRLDPIYMPVYKDFNEKFGLEQKRRISCAPTEIDYGSNVDGSSILMAAARILQRREKRKLMIVFSDGWPAASMNNSILRSHLQWAVKEIEKNGVEIIGVGIMSEAAKDFYPKNFQVNNIAELPAKVLGELRQFLTA